MCDGLKKVLNDDQFDGAWCSTISELDSVESLLTKLGRDFDLFVLSNTNHVHFEAVREMFPSWIELFNGFRLSYEIGLKKPSKEYFEAALQRFCLDPEKCVFLDDDLNNVLGAEALGIRSHKVGGRGLWEDELKAWGLL